MYFALYTLIANTKSGMYFVRAIFMTVIIYLLCLCTIKNIG